MATGTLYVVATPIGNLGDLSPRAAEVLRTVDAVSLGLLAMVVLNACALFVHGD